MENYAKTAEYKEILAKENLTIKQAEFIYNEMSKVNWKVRALKKAEYKIENLHPSCLKSLLEQYNKREDVNLLTGEIMNSDGTGDSLKITLDKGTTISMIRGIPFMPDVSGSMR